MITTLVISVLVILVVSLLYTTLNLLKKVERQEDIISNQIEILSSYQSYLNKFSDIIELSDKKLKEIDARGTFSSDDEVGYFFQSIKQLQETLNGFNVKNL
jgi:hypothetical protein